MDSDSIILVNPDEYKETEIELKRHFLAEQTIPQDPMFVWETMPQPRFRTVAGLEIERNELKKVLDLEASQIL